MGTRSMNFIALKPGVTPNDAFQSFMKDRATVLKDGRGTLVVYQSNFSPMWRRHGENCTADLEEEIVIQRFLGSLPGDSYYMKRAGEICDWRGDWAYHPFGGEQDVMEINATYQASIGRHQEGLEVEFPADHRVRIELDITAESPEAAANFVLNGIRDKTISPVVVEVSSAGGTKVVSVV